ncbi:hypothetical protein [Alsobacter sp. SYSU BS001988]|jgi:hypothetical protein
MDDRRTASVQFTDRQGAERAMQAALRAGFPKQDVSLTTSSDRRHFIVRVDAGDAYERAMAAIRGAGRGSRRLAEAITGEGAFPMAGPLLAAFAVGYLIRFARS